MQELVDYAENTDGLVQLRASYVEASEPVNICADAICCLASVPGAPGRNLQ